MSLMPGVQQSRAIYHGLKHPKIGCAGSRLQSLPRSILILAYWTPVAEAVLSPP